ncbi:PfaD family polyunsaturated fatty acid/polyketide biosynthesis protein [Kolteria novifilia]|uniref:PfaD family polyunsaturated fatty acid/polyketide biosynthesis protein n=1 Tax=Kolteria novifilia TaxID=2527975 RepID=UPI003AF3489F
MFGRTSILTAVDQFRRPAGIYRQRETGLIGATAVDDLSTASLLASADEGIESVGMLPALYPEWLGDRSFLESHGVRFPYVAGAMANGIATPAMVIAMARGGMLGFYGAAGLGPQHVEKGIVEIKKALGDSGGAWGVNLIHSPNEPTLEEANVRLLLRHEVRRVSASAFMNSSPNAVWYAYSGLSRRADGTIERPNHLFAKVSRPEVAERFLRPADAKIVAALVAEGKLTREEADLGSGLPVAEDITAEADSGGHTDNRPLPALLSTIVELRNQIVEELGDECRARVGAAGGLGTPASIAAAFAHGADYVLTGSVNQACLEAGVADEAKQMLATAGLADVVMAPAADMFEQGIKLQVLRRGTMFAGRAQQLYDCYRRYGGIDAIPDAERRRLEQQVFRRPIDDVWAETRAFWSKRDPSQVELADRDPKHLMALVFRWYLGKASRWAIEGETERAVDYQVWCGPAMGSFNQWAKGSFLEEPANRTVVQVALNLLEGAAAITRAQQLRSYGVDVPSVGFRYRPRPLRLK